MKTVTGKLKIGRGKDAVVIENANYTYFESLAEIQNSASGVDNVVKFVNKAKKIIVNSMLNAWKNANPAAIASDIAKQREKLDSNFSILSALSTKRGSKGPRIDATVDRLFGQKISEIVKSGGKVPNTKELDTMRAEILSGVVANIKAKDSKTPVVAK